MDIQLFDNYEDDGQLSLFRFDDSEYEMENEPKAEKTAEKAAEKRAETEKTFDLHLAPGGSGIRIQRCSSCGKLLFVREETAGYSASCNNCGIEYFQKM